MVWMPVCVRVPIMQYAVYSLASLKSCWMVFSFEHIAHLVQISCLGAHWGGMGQRQAHTLPRGPRAHFSDAPTLEK